MEAYTRLEFRNLCRLCISFSQSNRDLFDNCNSTPNLISKIFDCLSIKVEENDPLPKKICKPCLEKLEGYNDFRLACFNSESTLQCYYSLFKNTIDRDGTIFIKSSEVGAPEQTVLDIKPDLGLLGVERENINATCTSNVDNPNLLLNERDNVLIPPDFSTSSAEHIMKVGSTLQTLESLERSSTLAFNDSSDMLTKQMSEISRSSFPLTSDNENIIVLDINKCNILDFIDPSAAIYVVNTDTKSEESNLQGPLHLNEGSMISPELNRILNKSNISTDGTSEPLLDPQGIDKINEILNIYPDQKSSLKPLQVDTKICDEISGSVKTLEDRSLITVDEPENTNAINVAVNELMMVVPETLDSNNIAARTAEGSEKCLDHLTTNKSVVAPAVSNQSLIKPCQPCVSVSPQKRVMDSVASAIPLVMKQLDLALKSKTKASIRDIKSSILPLKHECTKCNKCFKNFKTLSKHIAAHSVLRRTTLKTEIPEVNKCGVCNKTFNTRRTLVAHMRGTHQDEGNRVFKCQHCDKAYGRNWHLNRHVETVHNPRTSKNELNCHICKKRFNRKEYLREHILRHNKAYKCNVCGMQCQNENAFRHHKATNCYFTSACETCGRIFDSKTIYLQHINSNCGQDVVMKPKTEEKPYDCTLCHRSFTERYKLKRHTEQHKRVVDVTKDNHHSGMVNVNNKKGSHEMKLISPASNMPFESPSMTEPVITLGIDPSNELTSKICHTELSISKKLAENTLNSSSPKKKTVDPTKNSMASAVLPVLKQVLKEPQVKSVPNSEVSVISKNNVTQLKDKKTSSENLNDILKDIMKKPIQRKNILTLLGKYLKPSLDKIPSSSRIQALSPKLSDKNSTSTLPIEEQEGTQKLKIVSSQTETVTRSDLVLNMVNEDPAASSHQLEKSVSNVQSISEKTAKTTNDQSLASVKIESSQVEDLSQVLMSQNLDNENTSLVKTPLGLGDKQSVLCNISTDFTDVQSQNNCGIIDKNLCQFTVNFETSRFSIKLGGPQDEEVPNSFLDKSLIAEKISSDLAKVELPKSYPMSEENHSIHENLSNPITDIQIQTADLALSINDNLPDTLLTFHPTFEKMPKMLCEKPLSFIEGPANNFVESSLENLIVGPEQNFESELDNLIKEAVQTLDECPTESFSVMPVPACSSVTVPDQMTFISDKPNEVSSPADLSSKELLGKESKEVYKISKKSIDEEISKPILQNAATTNKDLTMKPLLDMLDSRNNENISLSEEISSNNLSEMEINNGDKIAILNEEDVLQTSHEKVSENILEDPLSSKEVIKENLNKTAKKIEYPKEKIPNEVFAPPLEVTNKETVETLENYSISGKNVLKTHSEFQTVRVATDSIKEMTSEMVEINNLNCSKSEKQLQVNNLNCVSDKMESKDKEIFDLNVPLNSRYSQDPNKSKLKEKLHSNMKYKRLTPPGNVSSGVDKSGLREKRNICKEDNSNRQIHFDKGKDKCSQLSGSIVVEKEDSGQSKIIPCVTVTSTTDISRENDSPKRFPDKTVNKSDGSKQEKTSDNKMKGNAKVPIDTQNISDQFDSVRPSEGYVVVSNKRKHKSSKVLQKDNGECKNQLTVLNKKGCKHKENRNDQKKLNANVKRFKLSKDSNSDRYKIRECSIKIEHCDSLFTENIDVRRITNDTKENTGKNKILDQFETNLEDLKVTEPPKPEQMNMTESSDGSPSTAVTGESTKQPIRTIRILLERFDPHKIAQYSSKDHVVSKPQNLFQNQPYNLRKSKDVQTYICTMEDS